MAKHNTITTTYDAASLLVVDVRNYSDAFIAINVPTDGDGTAEVFEAMVYSCTSDGTTKGTMIVKYVQL